MTRVTQRQLTIECRQHGCTLDAAWPRIPVAHLSHETDTTFSTIHCRRG